MDKKKLIIYGGVAAVGVYLLTRSSDDSDPFMAGGGSGGGGLPLLGETLESAGSGDIIYNLGAPALEAPFSMSMPEITPDDSKKAVVSGKFVPIWEMTPTTQKDTLFASLADPSVVNPYSWEGLTGIPPDSAKPKKASAAKDVVERTQAGVGTYDVKNWNFQDAANNVGLWLLGADQPGKPTTAKPPTQDVFKFGGGQTRGTEGFGGDYSKKASAKTLTGKRESQRARDASTSRSRGFSRMTGVNQTPGWVQVGAKKPTAAGQPDRY